MAIVGQLGVRRVIVVIVAVPVLAAVLASTLLAGNEHRRAGAAAEEAGRIEAFGAVTSLHVASLAELTLLETWSSVPAVRSGAGAEAFEVIGASRRLEDQAWAELEDHAGHLDEESLAELVAVRAGLDELREWRRAGDDAAVADHAGDLLARLDGTVAELQHDAFEQGTSASWAALVNLGDLAARLTAESLLAMRIGAGDAGDDAIERFREATQASDLTASATDRALVAPQRGRFAELGESDLATTFRDLREPTQSPDPDDARTLSERLGELDEASAYVTAIDDFATEAVTDAARRAGAERAAATRAAVLFALAGLGLVLVAVGVAAVLGRALAARIERVAQGARRVSAGELDVEPLAMGGRDEIATLADVVDEMTATLRGVHHQLRILDDDRSEPEALGSPVPGPIGEALGVAIRRLGRTTEELRRRATRDELTGLLDQSELPAVMAEIDEGRTGPVAVGMIDLDRFKAVNDDHGHQAGDIVLVETARRLREVAREGDVACRRGGDEFVLLIRDVNDDAVLRSLSERLVTSLCHPIDIGTTLVSVGASVGWEIAEPGDALDAALERADAAMYEIKRATHSRGGGPTRAEPEHAGV